MLLNHRDKAMPDQNKINILLTSQSRNNLLIIFVLCVRNFLILNILNSKILFVVVNMRQII